MKTILLIMAAGMGSRFTGGIKQLEPIDTAGHIIVDYSIHDAIEAGFNKIIFIIRRDIEVDFKEIIGNRIEKICAKHDVEFSYVFQDIYDIPGELPEGRTKPWGTGQAVIAAKNDIDSPFAVINADDYYGKQAYRQLHEWLLLDHEADVYAMVGFNLRNTLSDNGGVTRGICQTDETGNYVINIVETNDIVKRVDDNGNILAERHGIKIDADGYVSMNMWGFSGNPPSFLCILEDGFKAFFEKEIKSEPLYAEYLLPRIIGQILDNKKCTVKLLKSTDKWFGITYLEDRLNVVSSVAALIDNGSYLQDLYSDL